MSSTVFSVGKCTKQGLDWQWYRAASWSLQKHQAVSALAFRPLTMAVFGEHLSKKYLFVTEEIPITQWPYGLKNHSLHYWRAPRGPRGVLRPISLNEMYWPEITREFQISFFLILFDKEIIVSKDLMKILWFIRVDEFLFFQK